MLLTIPYNPALPGGYDKLTSAIIRYGRHPNHTLFVASKQEHEDEAFLLAMKLKDHFGRYVAITVDEQPETMLKASNRLFVAAMNALDSYIPASSEMPEPVMLYMDPTWRPTRQHWLDELQAEFYIKGAPTTFGHYKDGKVIGPVAIKKDFLRKTRLLKFMPYDIHWRDYLAWEIINSGLQAEAFGRVLPAFIRPFDP